MFLAKEKFMQMITTHPQITALRHEFQTLAERFVQVLEETRTIRTAINPSILEQYDTLFGQWEFRLQQKTLEAAELQRREEIFRLKHERGETITAKTIEVVNLLVTREFIKIRQRLENTFLRSKKEREEFALKKKKNRQPAPELTAQYREIVKFLHPDTKNSYNHCLSDSQKEQYWHFTQQAYHNQNYKHLQDIFEMVVLLSHNNNIISDENSTSEKIEAEIGALRRRLASEKHYLKTLQNTEPYILRDVISNKTWIREEEQRFERDITEKESQILRSTAYLQTIYDGLDITIVNPIHIDDTVFQDDFLENTYFGNR